MPPHEQAQKYLDKANQLAAEHQFNAAFTQFEIAIRRQYRNASAHIYYGYALVEAAKYPESIEQFRKAIEFDPAEPLIVGQLVEAFYRDSRQEQDLEEFQKVVDKADRADLYHTWAQVLSSLQRGDRAIKEFKKALAKDPKLELNTDSAVKAFSHSKTVEQQITAFQEAADKLKHPHAWNSCGKILLGLARNAAAAKQFELAANAKNDWTTPYLNWARALYELTDYEQAIEVAKKALRCDERSLDAYITLGRALDQMGEHEQAACNYAAGAAYGPTNEYFFYWLQSLNKLSNPDPAINAYRLALEKSDLTTELFDWSPYVAFGTVLKELGRLPEGAFQFGKSLAVDHHYYSTVELQEALSDLDDREPTLDELQHIFDSVVDPARLAQWAQVLARINEVDRAKKQMSRVVEHLADRPWHLTSLGEAVTALESPADRHSAQAQIDRAIREIRDVQLELQWANLLANTFNEQQQAFSLYKELLLKAPAAPGLVGDFVRALKSSPAQSSLISEIDTAVKNKSDAAAPYQWAQILTGLDRSKSAIEHLKRAIELDETHVDAHYRLGHFYSQQGTYTKACQEYEKTVHLDQEHPAALQEWGTALLKNGRREEALEKYAQAVRARAALARRALSSPVPMTPVDIDVTAGDLISIVDRLTWNDEVIDRFQKVIDEINDPQSYREWGILLAKIKRPDRAIEQFKKAVDLDPDAHASYSEWLKVVGSSGLSAQRLAEYEQALVKYRNNAVAYSELGDFLYRMKRMEQAAQKYQRALELDPKNSHARGWLGYSFIAMNDLERARQEARQLMADDPSAGDAYDVLSWCAFVDGDYDEAVKQAELGISNNYFYLYDTCARALHKSGREDLALKKFQEAIEKHPDDIDLLYNYGAMLMEMNRYEEAAPVLEKVVQMKPDHVYANHNLAAIPFDKGRYEEAYVKWMHAIKVYKQQGSLLTRAIEQNRFVDSSEAYYHASVVLAIQHNHKEGEDVINEGLEFDPNNTLLLRLMADLQWEKKEELVGVDSETNRRKSEYHWRGMEHFQRAEKLLKERSKRYPNYYLLVELGDLYLLHEDFDKARQCFEEARTKDDTAYIPYAKLGVIYLRERQPDKAIPLLLEALKRNPDELDVKSSLAEAYLRAEKLDDAETTYRQVLAIAPNHVQSSIGLGELSSALGDKKDYDRYSEAIDHFSRALDIAENERIRSKYLKKAEAAAVYYQLGYARVQSYESAGIRKDTKLLEQAKKAFDNCIARNPSHQKARRAKEKIDKRLEFFSRDRLTETHGPRAIFWMSIIVFIFVQVAFFAVPFFNQPSLIVSDRSLQATAKQVPGAPVEKLSTIKNQKFSNHKTLSDALQGLLPEDGGKLAEAVMQHVESVKSFENVPDIPAGYYALLTFGSLLFMVVGLYLPQILKLRVAGIELEKSSVDQAGAGGTLGISKL